MIHTIIILELFMLFYMRHDCMTMTIICNGYVIITLNLNLKSKIRK